MVEAESDSVTVGASSSSVMVSVASDGDSAPPPPAAVPETVTCLSAESVVFGFAVTVTVPVLAVEPAAMVSVFAVLSVKSAASAPDDDTAAADTVIVVASLETPESVAVTVETPFASPTDAGESVSRVVGAASSSTRVSVRLAGAATPLPPDAVPETVTCLSGEPTALSLAVIVTVPVLAVEPAAMLRVRAALSVKSAASAPDDDTAAADTVIVVASLEAPESTAVTVATPPFSETDDEDSTSDTVDAPSSSRIVSVASGGSTAPRVPDAVPETVTVLSGASVALPTAVTVTVPALVVSPAAMVSVVALDSAKSPAIAGATGAADTVSVTAAAEGFESVAVTVATPALSEIEAGDSARAERGRASSSAMVSVTPAGAATSPCPPPTVPPTVAVSSGSSVVSSTAVTVTAPELVVAPAAMVSVLSLDRLKSPAAAVAPVADTVTVIASPEVPPLRLAVTVAALPAPLSLIVSGFPASGSDSASASVGVGSSSVIVPTPVAALPSTAPEGLLSATRTVSFGSSSASPVTVTSKVWLVCAAVKVSVPPVMAV